MKKKYLCAALLLVCLAMDGLVCAKKYLQENTHEYALMQMLAAIEQKDAARFETYVDVERVLYGIHENASELLAAHIGELHMRYPADWFFRHDAAFMEGYMAERRARDVAAARAMLDYYFDEKRVPVTREDGAARWGADEMRMFAAHYAAASIERRLSVQLPGRRERLRTPDARGQRLARARTAGYGALETCPD